MYTIDKLRYNRKEDFLYMSVGKWFSLYKKSLSDNLIPIYTSFCVLALFFSVRRTQEIKRKRKWCSVLEYLYHSLQTRTHIFPVIWQLSRGTEWYMLGTAQMIPKKKTALDYGNLWVNTSRGWGGRRSTWCRCYRQGLDQRVELCLLVIFTNYNIVYWQCFSYFRCA